MENSTPTTGELEQIIIVPNGQSSERLDKFLQNQKLNTQCSRTALQRLIKEGKISINNIATTKVGYKVKPKDQIHINFASLIEASLKTNTLEPEDIPLNILYEDDEILVLNKPAGMMVHGSPGHNSGTLVNALLHHCKTLSSIEGAERPGIVHRLDKDTSGIMVIAKTDSSHLHLKKQFSDHTTIKKYIAIVQGKPKDNGGLNIIDKAIARHPQDINKMVISSDGKPSTTHYTVEKVWNDKKQTFTQLDVRILTGRTHQIRVHMCSLGTPIIGDPIYASKSNKYNVPFLMLAAKYLEFEHPVTKQKMKFELVQMPTHIAEFITSCNNKTKET